MLLSNNPGRDYALIIGADSLIELHTWERIEELLTICVIIATNRFGFPLNWQDKDTVLAKLSKILVNKELLERVTFCETTAVDVSSTLVRERCREKSPINDLVPAAVAEYIAEHQLYQ